MIEQFDKTEHQREYEIDCLNLIKTIMGYAGENLSVNPETVEKTREACAHLVEMNLSEGKRRGKEELLKDLSGTVAEVEIKMTDFEVVELDGTNTKCLDYEKGFKLLKTILTGE